MDRNQKLLERKRRIAECKLQVEKAGLKKNDPRHRKIVSYVDHEDLGWTDCLNEFGELIGIARYGFRFGDDTRGLLDLVNGEPQESEPAGFLNTVG